MKFNRIRKQGKKSDYLQLKTALSDMPVIDTRSLSVKAKKKGVTKVSVRLIDSQSMIVIPKGKLLERKAVELVQKLAYEKVIRPEGLIDVHFKGFRAESDGGVWPPCRVTLKDRIVTGVEIKKRK